MPSRANFSSLALLLLVALLGGCSRHAPASTPAASPPPGADRVAYVRMSVLLKAHPLYPELARLDDDMEALQLRNIGPEAAHPGPELQRQEVALQRELDAAAARARSQLAQKQQFYAERERTAVAQALAAAGGLGTQSAAGIAQSIAAVSSQQARAAGETAQSNVDVYRRTLLAQEGAAIAIYQKDLGASADRTYVAEADRLRRGEADAALREAQADAAQKLSLRSKLSDLALDDASRTQIEAQLAAIDQREADDLGAQKNRDQATLAALQKQLRANLQRSLAARIAQLRARTVAKIASSEGQTRSALLAQLGTPAVAGGAAPPAITPALRAKLLALHRRFQGDFNHDAEQTIAAFAATRAQLSARFAALRGADGAAQGSAAAEMNALGRQRAQLYDEMVAQIGSEVRNLARKRGIAVVVSEVVAPADGVDLTDAARTAIEGLHE